MSKENTVKSSGQHDCIQEQNIKDLKRVDEDQWKAIITLDKEASKAIKDLALTLKENTTTNGYQNKDMEKLEKSFKEDLKEVKNEINDFKKEMEPVKTYIDAQKARDKSKKLNFDKKYMITIAVAAIIGAMVGVIGVIITLKL
ncbi:MAG: hypothetical protein K8E24_005210 [Methanobacterium paludis]|nr:hypothetical protein [Methanobacterium paludis]